MSLTNLYGTVAFKTEMDLVALGNILSEKILSGIPLEGLEERIYNEVPAIYVKSYNLLGLSIILQGWWDMSEEKDRYVLTISSHHYVQNKIENEGLINEYLITFCKKQLKEYPEIEVE